MKRIMLFTETGGPGGAERVIVELARAYRGLNAFVHVLTLRTGWFTEKLSAENIPWTQLASNRSFDISLPFRIAREMKKHSCDVLHSHLIDASFYGALAAKIAGVQHIATEHGDVHHISGKKLLRVKVKTISALCTAMTAVSNFTAKRLIELGARPEKVSVVFNPIPGGVAARMREDVRAELDVSPDEWVWIHVANFRPVKDQETLIRGFAKSLSLTNKKQRLILIGDGDLRSSLEAIARELGVSSSITFLGFKDDVHNYLGAADGFILTSRSEAMPMALLEAGESGLFLISSEVGGVKDILGENRGMLFPASNPDALADRIAECLSNPESVRNRAKQTQQFIRETFAPRLIAGQYLALLDKN